MLHSWYELAEAIAHEVGEVPLIPYVSARHTCRRSKNCYASFIGPI